MERKHGSVSIQPFQHCLPTYILHVIKSQPVSLHWTFFILFLAVFVVSDVYFLDLSSDGKTASFSPPEVVAPPGSKGQLEFQPSGITPISGKKEELPAVSSYSVGYPMESYQDKSALWNVELKVQDKRAETNKTVVENEVALSSGFVFRCHSFPTQQHTSILSHSSMSAEYEGSSFGGMISSYPPTTYPFSPTIYTEQSMSSSIPTLSHIPHPDPLPSPAYNPQPSSTFYPNSSQQVLASGQVDCKFCVQVSHNVCQRQPAAWSGTLQSHL